MGSVNRHSDDHHNADPDAPVPEDEEPKPKLADAPRPPVKPHPADRRPWPDIIRKEGTDDEHDP